MGKKKHNQKRSAEPAEGSSTPVSQKRKKIARTTGKLHTLTAAPATMDTSKQRIGQRTGSKNANIWCASLPGKTTTRTRTTITATTAQARVHPVVEDFRHACVAKSRVTLDKLCKQHTGQPAPLVAWERWQCSSILHEHLTFGKQQRGQGGQAPQATRDWILPSSGVLEPGLLADLERIQVPAAARAGVAEAMARAAAALAQEVRRKGVEIGEARAGELVKVVRHKHSCDVQLAAGARPRLLKLNLPHHDKLRALWNLHSPHAAAAGGAAVANQTNTSAGGDGGGDSGRLAQQQTKDFHEDLYSMLCRYNALLGHGMQCALSEHCFEALYRWLQVDVECFASPLNCRYPRFCSAFPDTDACFGSLGSFFDFDFPAAPQSDGVDRGYSVEANPPFIPSIMVAMVERIQRVLSESLVTGVPLSFVVVVPGWTEVVSWTMLNKSEFLHQPPILIAAADHGYCSGAQHQRKDRYMESAYDTAIFLLQNPRGREIHGFGARQQTQPTTQEKLRELESEWYLEMEKDLRGAFAQAAPTEAMKQRRLKEGRGFGDKDGGGGVFKGKKKNAKDRAQGHHGKKKSFKGKKKLGS